MFPGLVSDSSSFLQQKLPVNEAGVQFCSPWVFLANWNLMLFEQEDVQCIFKGRCNTKKWTDQERALFLAGPATSRSRNALVSKQRRSCAAMASRPVVPDSYNHVLAEFECLDPLLSALRLDSSRLKVNLWCLGIFFVFVFKIKMLFGLLPD